jgi:hypothetical protein
MLTTKGVYGVEVLPHARGKVSGGRLSRRFIFQAGRKGFVDAEGGANASSRARSIFTKDDGNNRSLGSEVGLAGNIFRLLGFYDKTGALVLTHGFTKKTQKTPPKEIETAERRKHEYENR